MAALILAQPWVHEKRAGIAARPEPVVIEILGVDYVHDLQRARVHHHDLVVDQEELISTPFRVDGHDLPRQRMEGHRARYADAGPDLKVDVGNRLNALF